MNLSSQIAIVIRSIGERTTEACLKSIEAQGFARSEITVTHASPFSEALRQSLEAGRKAGKDWTFIVDADVILRHDAIARMHQVACSRPDRVCEVHGLVLDKLFNEFRLAGNHMYRTSLIPKVLECVSHEGQISRPETHALNAMSAAGFPVEKVAVNIGLHDFEQRCIDIFRKCFLQAHKHIQRSGTFLPLWRERAQEDPDFRVALEGFVFGLHYTPDVMADAEDDAVRAAFEKLGIPEKSGVFAHPDPAGWATEVTDRAISGNSVNVIGFELDARDLDQARPLRHLALSRAQTIEKLTRDHGSLRSGIYMIGEGLERIGRMVKLRSGARLAHRGDTSSPVNAKPLRTTPL